jgi:hypothetical protein
MQESKRSRFFPKLRLSRNAKGNLRIIGAFSLFSLAVIFISYLLMVLWIPAWFPPPPKDLPFDLSFFTYTSPTQTSTGEPVNLIIMADTGQQIVDEFKKVGLIQILSVDQQSVGTTIKNALEERVTPISKRYLFGREQDYAFQSRSDSVAHRHHLRVWRYDDHTWGGKPVWLVSASYDKGLGLSLSGFLPVPTHMVSPNIDNERDYFADMLVRHDLVSRRIHAPGVGPYLFRSNGDLSFFFTDGEVVVLTLGETSTGKPDIEPWYWSMLVRQKYFDMPTLILQFLGLAQVYGTPSTVLMTIEESVR